MSHQEVRVAAIQMACSKSLEANIATAERLVRQAASGEHGAHIVLLPELFLDEYFCKNQSATHFETALDARPEHNAPLRHFMALARELHVVLPFSFFEKANNVYYNSVAMIDADGSVRGLYRKSHIPDGPGYQEKFYFSVGDTGFEVFETAFGTVGVGICWDQWFPEAARIMALKGADVLLYPTAIGSEPQDASLDSQGHWTRVMQGHSAANLVPVVAANRVGIERSPAAPGIAECTTTFYGSSFITDTTGALAETANRTDECVLVHSFDLVANRRQRASWGLFRDRRIDLYRPLLTKDGHTHPRT